MRITGVFRYIMILAAFSMAAAVSAQSVRQERRLITEGNKLYVERKFKDAASKYKEALDVNASSSVAKYNLGMAQIRQVANPKDTTAKNAALLDNGMKMLSEVAKMVKEKPGLASKANYNLGNLEFNRENYSGAINFYKEALRIDPGDNNARKNLRIAQLKQQNQNNQDQNKDQNKDNKDQNKDQNKQDQNKEQDQQKDQDKNKDQDQNKDQNKDNDKQNKDINNQTASQILQAIDNKESQTRARVNRANKGDKSSAAGRRVK
ncbi:MAG: tetratricopeptide repeat protein, partial [Muribaculaceae bacterium]|nr:tetratricopeptide repeat protein [Muribaculaceae bacterium]